MIVLEWLHVRDMTLCTWGDRFYPSVTLYIDYITWNISQKCVQHVAEHTLMSLCLHEYYFNKNTIDRVPVRIRIHVQFDNLRHPYILNWCHVSICVVGVALHSDRPQIRSQVTSETPSPPSADTQRSCTHRYAELPRHPGVSTPRCTVTWSTSCVVTGVRRTITASCGWSTVKVNKKFLRLCE